MTYSTLAILKHESLLITAKTFLTPEIRQRKNTMDLSLSLNKYKEKL